MKILKKVTKNNWDFILYRTNEGYVFNVVFHASASDFSRSFRINDEEANLDFEGLKRLSEKIRNDYKSFKDREIIPVVRM